MRDRTPNTAITASPMNFSTAPPCDSTIAFIRSKYLASKARSASGSVDSPSAVEPVTSQNSTVTVFRCSRLSAVSGAALITESRAFRVLLAPSGASRHRASVGQGCSAVMCSEPPLEHGQVLRKPPGTFARRRPFLGRGLPRGCQ
jgi:hypothetical protein